MRISGGKQNSALVPTWNRITGNRLSMIWRRRLATTRQTQFLRTYNPGDADNSAEGRSDSDRARLACRSGRACNRGNFEGCCSEGCGYCTAGSGSGYAGSARRSKHSSTSPTLSLLCSVNRNDRYTN